MGWCNHFRVLLKKNYLTLWRNFCFAIFFMIIPIITMGIFQQLRQYLGSSQTPMYYTLPSTVYYSSSAPVRDWDPFGGQDAQTDLIGRAVPQDSSSDKQFVMVRPQHCASFAKQWVDRSNLERVGWWQRQPFTSEESFLSSIKTAKDTDYAFAISIQQCDQITQTYKFRLIYKWELLPDTNNPMYSSILRLPDFTSYGRYYEGKIFGAISLLAGVIQNINNKGQDRIQVAYSGMKTPSFDSMDPFIIEMLTQNFPFFFMFTFLVPLYYFVSKLAEEKESKSREGMKMMGLTDSAYYVSWFVFYVLIILIMCVLATYMVSTDVIGKSNYWFFFGIAFAYGMTTYGFSFVVVSLISRQRSSATTASLFHLISYFLAFSCNGPAAPWIFKISMSLIPNVAMYLGMQHLFYYEMQGDGMQWKESNTTYKNFTFMWALQMLIFDAILFIILGLYFDQILKSQFGVAKPFYFCLLPSYWCPKKRRDNMITKESKKKFEQFLEQEQQLETPRGGDNEADEQNLDFEAIPESLRKQELDNNCLQMKNLRKTFGKKVAVDNTNLTLYNGQIFALLGHNGAGKTTTISMLTGLLPQSKGNAQCFGINIFENMQSFRQILGVCPQHDVLFEYLTVEEHLHLFAAFKGSPYKEAKIQVDKMIIDLELTPVKNQRAKTLSGGQKRKLSVGIALIGNSKVVMLDEPTSGMDTSTRRKLWDMLKLYKRDKILILTTHYMDEADILGDRIGIMSEGKVKCVGSSLFLKKRFGVGYNLIIAKKKREPAPFIEQFVVQNIPGAIKLSEVSSEITFQLPASSSLLFKPFFSLLDENIDLLEISSYGVGITSLEEVFMKIARSDKEIEEDLHKELVAEEQKKQQQQKLMIEGGKVVITGKKQMSTDINEYLFEKDRSDINKSYVESTNPQKNEGNIKPEEIRFEKNCCKKGCTQFCAMTKKKILVQFRDPKTLCIELLFPIFLIFGGLALQTFNLVEDSQPKLLDITQFPQPSPLFYNSRTPTNAQNISIATDQIMQRFSARPSQWNLLPNPYQPLDDEHYMIQYLQFDQNIFNRRSSMPQGFYGDYYFYRLPVPQQWWEQNPRLYSVITFANLTSQDAVGAFSVAIHEILLREIINNNDLTFQVEVQTFPLNAKERTFIRALQGSVTTILFAIGFMMISASLIQNIIKEREKNIKHQMIVSGASLFSYWMSHYIGDIIFQAIPAGFAIGGIYIFDIDLPYVYILFGVFIFANPPFIYVLSFFFERESTGGIFIRLIYLIFGALMPIAVSILKEIKNIYVEKYTQRVFWALLPIPIYAMDFGIINISNQTLFNILFKKPFGHPLDWNIAGLSILFLVAVTPFYLLMILLIESQIIQWSYNRSKQYLIMKCSRLAKQPKIRDDLDIDEDITNEEARVRQGIEEGSKFAVDVLKLRKTIASVFKKTVVAVDDVSFALENGECFALLGVSGAGKTTTFKCLTGQAYPTSGSVRIGGYDVTTKKGFDSVRRKIGYCPQFDAIFAEMTVFEHLDFYARIKSIHASQRAQIIESQIKEMDLSEYRNVQSQYLSGGNKRKLSVAMAMIGNPEIIFLDEPSTGVDPKAKRFMWSIVSKISTLRQDSAVVITTHSMEEAEALATKMGIMVGGRFKCFGSSQHIKGKYGTGFEIEVKIRTLGEDEIQRTLLQNGLLNIQSLNRVEFMNVLQQLDAGELSDQICEDGLGSDFHDTFSKEQPVDVEELVKWVFVEKHGATLIGQLESKFPSLELLEHFNNFYKFKINRDQFSIGYLFGFMEDLKDECEVSEYAISQTSLEQIFNNFAMEAEQKILQQRKSFRRSQLRRSMDQMNKSTQNLMEEGKKNN